MAVYRLDLRYDGSGFHGYARNPGVRTIQGSLEDALAQVLGVPVVTEVAGRTDAGVHALGQVVSFELDGDVEVEKLERSLDSMLGKEVAVVALTEADAGFSAWRSAKSRVYRYFIDDSAVPNPLERNSVWHVPEHLDVDPMNRAAEAFVGVHDFASLCRAAPGKSTVRTVIRAVWERRGGLLVLEAEARAYCHQMVRSMVLLCVDVGHGRIDPDSIPGVLAALDRNATRGAAPPHGLVLWEVRY